ncbi:hypothetical protein M2135_003064 [Parabacteroides sp. PF5-9]|nr:hypothetical protein [Parabacteroides sp. PF5-9]
MASKKYFKERHSQVTGIVSIFHTIIIKTKDDGNEEKFRIRHKRDLTRL